jgi:ATP-dependent exoDNAse (exonuclease V) alpha subunit
MKKKKFSGISDVLRLRLRCRVVIKNNMNYKIKGEMQRIVNGETGTFFGVDKYDRLIILRDRDQEYIYVKAKKFEDIKHEVVETNDPNKPIEIVDKKTGAFKQYPIDLAYAMTVHGAQGATLDRVHMDLPEAGNKFLNKTPGLIYVGLSRIRAFKYLTLSRPLLHSDIVVSKSVLKQEAIQGEL